MRAIDLESRVITAVDRIRAGQLVEHDLIECKRSWPQESKARQLAGSLNRAGGDPVVYIIGIDEKTGDVHDVSDTDVLDWWGQITPRFDQAAPEMVRHISVPVGNGEHVVAVAFASDRAPYVVKTSSANPSLEVPMREGTGTRTARRDELLRLLIPSAAVPQAVVLDAGLYVEYFPSVPERMHPINGNKMAAQKEDVSSFGSLRIYVEHDGKDPVTFPAHGMRGRLLVDSESFDLKVRQSRESTSMVASRDLTAVAAPRDGVTINGPRGVSIDVGIRELTPENIFWLEAAQSVRYEIELDILHAVKPLKVGVTLKPSKDQYPDADNLRNEYQQVIGQWSFGHPGLWTNG
jgi:hypothetical protein